MAKFLNTDGLNEWIPRLIQEAEKELVLVVPYVRISNKILSLLTEANQRGVETVLVYRENKMHDLEKKKLWALDNLNVFHHPNLHAKCFMNEKYLIIGSMNLHQYSAENNREMAMLLHLVEIGPTRSLDSTDSKQIFEDARAEVKEIIIGAHLQKKSRETKEEGFKISIVETSEDKALEECQRLSKFFGHKKFKPEKNGIEWYPVCRNYFDKIHLTITGNRAEFKLDLPEERVEQVFKKLEPQVQEYMFKGFKVYWNWYKGDFLLYRDKKYSAWNNKERDLELFKKGIDKVIEFLRKGMETTKKTK